MAEYHGKHFENTTEELDGNKYDMCTFSGCTCIYRGGAIPIFSGCRLDRCEWRFEDAARRTLDLLRGMYSGMGPGGRQLIEAIINRQIRAPFPPLPGSGGAAPGTSAIS